MANSLKSYPPTWDGDLLLACRKCQKKLKGEPGMEALAKLKKTIKRHNKQQQQSSETSSRSVRRLHVIGVPCLDLCPKGAVTICLPAKQPAALSILRKEHEIDALYRT